MFTPPPPPHHQKKKVLHKHCFQFLLGFTRGNIVVYLQLHLADKIGIVFETSKPKTVSSQFLFGKHLSALETIVRPLHLTTFAFVNGGLDVSYPRTFRTQTIRTQS